MSSMIVSILITALSVSALWFGLYRIKLDVELDRERDRYRELQSRYVHLEQQILDLGQSSQTATPLSQAYQTLGLTYGASLEQVKIRYRQLIKRYHPDLNHTASGAKSFKQVMDAFNLIKVRG